MGRYSVEIKKSAVKEIKNLPPEVLKKVLAKIDALSQDPRPHDSIKLSAQEKYRVRLGDYRILYEIMDKAVVVFVVKVGHRKDIYR